MGSRNEKLFFPIKVLISAIIIEERNSKCSWKGVDDSLRDAYIGLHATYIQAVTHYIEASSLPDEFFESFIAFMTAGKAVESTLNAKQKNVVALAVSASDYAANPNILMQFSSSSLMGLSPNTYQNSGEYIAAGSLENVCRRLIQAGFVFDTSSGGTMFVSKRKTCYLYYNDRTLMAKIEDIGEM